MNDNSILFFLICVIFGLFAALIYQWFAFGRGTQAKLEEISRNLEDILNRDSGEKVMVFTDNKALAKLSGQINRLLLDRQKVKADYRRQELSTRKMLANISHDIKTPLTVILGYLEILRMEEGENETLQKVEAKAKQVMELMEQFFTLAKLEAGDMDLEAEKLDSCELCRECVLGFYELLCRKAFAVEVSVPEGKIFVRGDRACVHRILNNLLSNAIRYGADGNYIGIFLREEEDFVAIDIADRGRGIEKESMEYVFDRLYTTEDSRSRRMQGNGLGLTIARNLARQMGGDILLQSEPYVRTVFTVRLQRWAAEEERNQGNGMEERKGRNGMKKIETEEIA